MQTKYTVVKDGGKWWVMEYVGNEPIPEMYKERSVFNIDFTEYNLKYNNAYTNKLPTLPEHADYWAKLEGKVIEEGEFEIATKLIDKRCRLTAIPKQESQEDIWNEVNKKATYYANEKRGSIDWGIDESLWFSEFIKYIQTYFTITRK